MAWFRRRREPEFRAITDLPWDVGAPTHAVVTQDRALTLAPVYSAVRHIGDTISTLPLDAFRKIGARREPMASLPLLFRQLNDDGLLVDWLFVALSSLSLRGNAVGLVTERDGMGFPTEIRWLPMHEVAVDDSMWPIVVWYYKGRRIDPTELVHIPWFTVAGRTLGLSPIEAYALTISNGLGAQTYGVDFFNNGGIPPGTFKNAGKKIDKTEADIIRGRLTSSIRTRQPLVYGMDWDYNPITIPPEQAQFVESLQFNANQIAAVYGIAPEEVGGVPGDSMTYQNEEHRQTRRMQDLRPWMVRLEHKFSSWLPDLQHVRFNADAVVRADLKSRHEVYKLDREIGLLSIDEIRALEDMPPLPDGQGTDYSPLSKPAAPPPPPPPPPPAGSNSNGQSDALARS